MATESDFDKVNRHLSKLAGRQNEFVHILEHQATLVNESLSENRENAMMIQVLTDHHARANKAISRAIVSLAENVTIAKKHLDIVMQVEETFDTFSVSLNWLMQYANDLEVGIATLPNRRLPPQFFPPPLLRKVLDTIRHQLPKGWALASTMKRGNDIWNTDHDAEVSLAETSSSLLMFVRIPVYEQLHRFTLYRVIGLPEATPSGNQSMTFANLPQYLAVSADRDTFVELTSEGAGRCVQQPTAVCHFYTPIGRSLLSTSCALAIYLRDAAKEAKLCHANSRTGRAHSLFIWAIVAGQYRVPPRKMETSATSPDPSAFDSTARSPAAENPRRGCT